jgi:hypothetical protein
MYLTPAEYAKLKSVFEHEPVLLLYDKQEAAGK